MEFVVVRQMLAVLLLSLPVVIAAGVGGARADDVAVEATAKTHRGAWVTAELRRESRRESRRLRLLGAAQKSSTTSTPDRADAKMGFSTFTRVRDSRRVRVLH
jgi:hypothetical protein